jgi:hypothetical protein
MVLVYLSLAKNRIFALPYCTWCYILIRITYCRLSRQLCQTLRFQSRAHSLRVYLQRLRALALRLPAFKFLFWLCRPVKRGLHGRNFGSLIHSIVYTLLPRLQQRGKNVRLVISNFQKHISCKMQEYPSQ